MFNRKLSVALIAGALELYAASVAHAACPAPNGATPFAAGPLNPVDGYAEYVTDSQGLALQICRNADLCFFDPAIAGNLLSDQTGTGTESFYWLSQATITDATTGFDALLVMGTEATYTTPEPVAGEQLSFTRLRIRLDVPAPGIYRVEHPFGAETYRIEAVAAGRDLSETFDISFVPGQLDALGKVGPWLTWDPLLAPPPPAGYIGDGATPQPVTGSPCGTNFLRVTATDFNGLPIRINANGSNTVSTSLFVVQGQVYDGRVQTPLSTDRVTYARTPTTVGQIDAFAHSLAGAAVTIQDGRGTPAANARLSTARPLTGDANGAFFTSEVLAATPNTAALPGAIDVTATVADASTDSTRLVRALVDQVTITQADYDLSTNRLTIAANSSDTRVPPSLTVQEYLSPVGQAITTLAPPAIVTVMSSAGGWDRAPVRTIAAVAPAAPTAPTATVNSPTQVTLVWGDASTNETGFEVTRNGVVITTLAANATSFVDTTAPQDSTLTYTIVAVNSGGRAASVPVTVTTPVRLLAPTGLAASNVSTTSVTLSWLDNADNETGYSVLRNGVTIATLAANSRIHVDTGVVASTTYSYQVVANHPRASAASATLSVTTPSAISIVAPTGLSAAAGTTANSAVLRWTDASTGESAYRVQRAPITIAANGTATTGVFGTLTTPSGNLAANASTVTNTGLGTAALYAYQVNAVNGAVQGPTARVNHYNGTLPVPGGLRSNVTAGVLGIGATPAGRVPLSWTASTVAAVAGYDIQRCVGTTTVCTATSGNWVNVTTVNGRATASFTVTGLPSGQLNQFRIRSTTGATIGLTGAWSAAAAGTPR
jgi:hypothetical protein